MLIQYPTTISIDTNAIVTGQSRAPFATKNINRCISWSMYMYLADYSNFELALDDRNLLDLGCGKAPQVQFFNNSHPPILIFPVACR